MPRSLHFIGFQTSPLTPVTALQEDRSIARWKGGRKATAVFPAIGAVFSHMRSSMRSGLAEVKHGFGDTSHKVLNRRAFYVRGVPVTQQPAGAASGLMGPALTETVSQLQAVETQTRQPAAVIPGAASTLPVQQPIAQPMTQPMTQPIAQQPMAQPMKQPMMEQPLAAKQAPIQSGQPMQPMQPSSLLSPRGTNIGSGMNANLPVYTAQ